MFLKSCLLTCRRLWGWRPLQNNRAMDEIYCAPSWSAHPGPSANQIRLNYQNILSRGWNTDNVCTECDDTQPWPLGEIKTFFLRMEFSLNSQRWQDLRHICKRKHFSEPIYASFCKCVSDPVSAVILGKTRVWWEVQNFIKYLMTYFCLQCFFGTHIHMSYFGATGTPVLDFWWRLFWVSKPKWVLPYFMCTAGYA